MKAVQQPRALATREKILKAGLPAMLGDRLPLGA